MMTSSSSRLASIYSVLVLCSLSAAYSLAWQPPAARVQPNIIFILADDLGYADTGAFGGRRIHTPNIDRLARQGRRLTQYYTGAVVCAPSRALLMTGRYTIHNGVTANTHDLAEAQTTIAEALKGLGYATALVGKWHRGRGDNWVHPNRHGFDYFFGFVDATAAHEYYPKELWENGATHANSSYATDRFTEKALEFIQQNAKRPFFLYLPYTAPHFKIQVLPQAVGRYKGAFAETDASNPLMRDLRRNGYPDGLKGSAEFSTSYGS